MIVVDVGCATQGPEESTYKLYKRFHPDRYYGFDPLLSSSDARLIHLVPVAHTTARTIAAWTYDGFIGLERHTDPQRTRVCDECGPEAVPCFDLASFLTDLNDSRLILKLDVEGAEMTLLPHLYERGVDQLLELLLVEWHCETCGTGGGEHTPECVLPSIPKVGGLRCPVEEWV